MTGDDRNREIQPSRSRPTATMRTPTTSAMKVTRWVYRGVPATATAATPAAKTGAIVESAPTDMCRWEPISANIRDPATKAYSPAAAGMMAR